MSEPKITDRDGIRQYFDKVVWERDEKGEYGFGSVFAPDDWDAWRDYCRTAVLRERKYLPPKGKYFFEEGCGAFPVEEFSRGYAKHVCVDVSLNALKGARARLGVRGWYVLADVARLPFKEGVFDAGFSTFVLYHLVKEDQPLALEEFCRVLRPGRQGLIIYMHDWPLVKRIEGVLRKLGVSGWINRWRKRNVAGTNASPRVTAYNYPRSWFRERLNTDGHRVRIHTHLIFTPGMSEVLPRIWLGRWVLRFASFLEKLFPRLTLFLSTHLTVEIEIGPRPHAASRAEDASA